VRRWLDHASARALCRVVITVSEAQRRVYQRAAGVKAERIQTCRHGVDTAVFRPDPAARERLRATLGLEPGALVFAVVALLRPGKGHADLLHALARVRLRAPAVRVLAAGDGVERPRLEALAAGLGVADLVRFLGARSDVPALLAASDAYVHPSLAEALPTSVLEAMAVGLPVVATDVGGVPEIVAHERTGLLVPAGRPDRLADAMLRLTDPALRVAMGAAGRAWAQAHGSSTLWLDRVHALYRRVAGVA
jgi:glycosyltransferase involved in cell wall biosynthesis